MAASKTLSDKAIRAVIKTAGETGKPATVNDAVESGALRTFEPGRSARMVYGAGEGEFSRVRDFHDEAYWDDLNHWLSTYENRIAFRFPAPTLSCAPQGSGSTHQREDAATRQSRRLDRFRELGGELEPQPGGKWKVDGGVRGALARLAREEAAAQRPYKDDRDISNDIKEEASRRRSNKAMPRG